MTAMIHPTALVETDRVGANTNIRAFVHVMPEVTIGADCMIGEHAFLESGAEVGNGVVIKNNVLIWKGVQIGDYAFIGPNVVFTNDRTPRSPRLPQIQAAHRTEKDWLRTTVVGEGASIGANVTVVAGVTIGRFAMVGAGCVVTRNIPDFALVAGNPSKLIGWVNELGDRVERKPNPADL
ncbi:MAG: acyltransferase [Kiritimatiellia bacterium]|nr:acyltransferase [Kiritimatiellia bacterium]